MEITGQMLIADVLRKYPETSRVFEENNMGCLSCLGLKGETVEKGCVMHGLDTEAFLTLLKEAAE